MSAVELTPLDLEPFADIPLEKAAAMVDDVLAMAARVAPCITDDDFAYPDAAKAILRGAVLRWHEAGTGAMQSESAGPFAATFDTRQQRRGMFWPSEIEQLQDLCKGDEPTGIFGIDTYPCGSIHSPVCSLVFGALYCSCGADLTLSYPLYEDVEP